MTLYRIRWRSLKDPRIGGYESPKLFTWEYAEQHCERLNNVYRECVTHWPEEVGTDASFIAAQK